MKKYINKTNGIIAVLISLVSLGFLAATIAFGFKELPDDYMGMPPSFAFWVYSMIFSLISMVFYFLDAVHSIELATIKKIFPAFNIIFALIVFLGIPVAIFIGGGVYTAVWYVYYAVIILLEIVSVVKHIKMKRSPEA